MTAKYIEYSELSPYELLERLDITTYPICPKKIAKELGIEVRDNFDIEKIGKENEGQAFVEKKKAVIWINKFLSLNRAKFTLAHEIAHVINDIAPHLKKGTFNTDNVFTDDSMNLSFARSGESNIVEYIANDYAGKLLMPKDFILECGKELTKDKPLTKSAFIQQMAKKFEVSESAMSIRLIRLGIIE